MPTRVVGSRVEPGHHALVEGMDGTEGIITQSGAGLTPALGDGRGIDPWRESPHVIRGRAGESDLGGSGVQIGLHRQQGPAGVAHERAQGPVAQVIPRRVA